jgi:hypothetical protein
VKKILLITFILIAAAGTGSAKSGIEGTKVLLAPGVLDLRGHHQFKKRDGNTPKGYHTPADLKVGTVFIDANNEARKVVAIYTENGKTVIDTVQPEMEEAMIGFEIPDQEINFTAEDIDPLSLRDGVTVMNPAAGSSVSSRAVIPTESKWLETDPNWMGSNVVTVKIDTNLFEGGAEGNLLEDDDGEEGGGGMPESELNVGVSGNIKLEGYLRLAEPKLTVGAKMPRLVFHSPLDWFSSGVVEHKPGYLRASFEAAEQLDCELTGSLSLSAELNIPLYAFLVQDEKGNKFLIGVYLKVSLEGTITVNFEISEYVNFALSANVDVAWPFIPYDVRFSSSSYANFAVRPTISAEVEKRVGLYLGVQGTILGFDVLAAEAGGGVYANASGWIMAKGIIGYNSDEGVYGSLNDWIWEIVLELGGYIEGNMTVLFWDIDLFEKKWPFLTTDYAGEINL